ncbi:hypothetical protein LBW59_20270 [Ralstonia solanacearum]|uniref:Uncharacterized protein n=1 Tax=Ralstonia solanacearum TaxID=305 RepID=A0AAW5ZTG9_RALSL|nr:hypothetical protein [Ralstonia solanacearum]MDB0573094.1 hypothetical protein [Ralstonia solanacearum]
MTTEKQLTANRKNAHKSTGPSTAQGKAKASGNARRHGVLSTRLFLEDENPEEFRLLFDGMRASLAPVGDLELLLVEKIAVSTWRQHRFVRAETASIELGRSLDMPSNRRQIERALGMAYPQEIRNQDLWPVSEDDVAMVEYWRELGKEFGQAYVALSAGNTERLEQDAPLLYSRLASDANAKGLEVADFVAGYEGGLFAWAKKKATDASSEVRTHERRIAVLEVAALVKGQQSAPINQQLLARYQTALDNELYRAIRALREAQEWRLKTIDSPAQGVE